MHWHQPAVIRQLQFVMVLLSQITQHFWQCWITSEITWQSSQPMFKMCSWKPKMQITMEYSSARFEPQARLAKSQCKRICRSSGSGTKMLATNSPFRYAMTSLRACKVPMSVIQLAMHSLVYRPVMTDSDGMSLTRPPSGFTIMIMILPIKICIRQSA